MTQSHNATRKLPRFPLSVFICLLILASPITSADGLFVFDKPLLEAEKIHPLVQAAEDLPKDWQTVYAQVKNPTSRSNWLDAGELPLFSDAAYWIFLQLKNDSAQTRNLSLYARHNLIPVVDVYFIENGQLVEEHKLGFLRPMAERPYRTTYVSFPVSVAP